MQNNNSESISMLDAIDDIEADVLSIYLHGFDENVSEEEKVEKLSEMFKISTHEVEQIIKDE
jgi:hypothetical protein